jgi:hypothetical protein
MCCTSYCVFLLPQTSAKETNHTKGAATLEAVAICSFHVSCRAGRPSYSRACHKYTRPGLLSLSRRNRGRSCRSSQQPRVHPRSLGRPKANFLSRSAAVAPEQASHPLPLPWYLSIACADICLDSPPLPSLDHVWSCLATPALSASGLSVLPHLDSFFDWFVFHLLISLAICVSPISLLLQH